MPEELKTEEQHIREMWLDFWLEKADVRFGLVDQDEYGWQATVQDWSSIPSETKEEAESALEQYTNQRKQEIAEVEEAIQWMNDRESAARSKAIAARILGLLQGRLADLKRGTVMEEKVDGK